jgi:hypothetical protein
MSDATKLADRLEGQVREDYLRMRARGSACAGTPPSSSAGEFAARSYVARRYRRQVRWIRRHQVDLALAAGALVWLTLVGLAGGWLLRGGA